MVNVLALSGTNPSFMIIRDWILNGRLKGELAVQTIAMLSGTIKTPTKELLASFIVIFSPAYEEYSRLSTTILLFFSGFDEV